MKGRDALMRQLQAWRERGWLGALDLALARFAAEQQPDVPPSLLLAVAWLGQLSSQGHVCLDLEVLAGDGPGLLGAHESAIATLREAAAALPGDARGAEVAWAGAAPLLAVRPGNDTSSPLVLDGPRLYLRRFWACERAVARELCALASAAADDAVQAGQAASRWLDRLFAPPAVGAGAGAVGGAPGLADAQADVAEPGPSLARAERPVDRGADRRSDGQTDGPTGGQTHRQSDGQTDGQTDRQTDWQRVACERALQRRLAVITGGPGTGKTHTAARLLVLLHLLHGGSEPLRVALAAPTGKAAARLRQSLLASIEALRGDPAIPAEVLARAAAAPAGTLHALLGARPGTRRLARGRQRPLLADLVLVDEASMVHVELMAALLDALPAHARLVLLGDGDQLASVEAGSVMADLCSAQPPSPVALQTVQLRHSHRFGGAIGALAQAVHAGDAGALQAALCAADGPECRTLRLPASRGELSGTAIAQAALATDADSWPTHGNWLRALAQRPADASDFEPWVAMLLRGLEAFRVLCALRDGERGVAGVNAAIERVAQQRGWIERRGEWYEGRPLLVTRNDPQLRLFNGDVGLVLRAPQAGDGRAGALCAWFADGGVLRSVAVGRLAAVETAFALTVHKSQGAEFEHVLMVLPDAPSPVLTRELLYTGITRAQRRLTLALHDPAVAQAAAARRTRRMSGLRERLQS